MAPAPARSRPSAMTGDRCRASSDPPGLPPGRSSGKPNLDHPAIFASRDELPEELGTQDRNVCFHGQQGSLRKLVELYGAFRCMQEGI